VRTLINAIFYVTKTGCQWRFLPNDFPPWQTVYSFFRRAKLKGILKKLLHLVVGVARALVGKNEAPTFGIIDSQSVKTVGPADCRGFDGGKKVKGRKRHIVTDTQGNLLHVRVHAANIHDTVAGCAVITAAVANYPTLKRICADGGYRNTTENFAQAALGRTVEISPKISKEWRVIPNRWVVERTFGWFNAARRLAKDFEITTSSEECMVMIAHCMTLLKRVQRRKF
jgi:putative transposase